MLTYTGARNLYGTLTDNTSSANLTVGDTLLNEGIRLMLGTSDWPFLEAQATASTVASQQFYNLPVDISQIISPTITVGTVIYRPRQVASRDQWDFVNSTTSVTSDVPSYFYILGNTIGFWPIPASNGNTITYNYEKLVRDISVADFTTGTITTLAAAGTTVTGTGTSWTAGMVGSYIRITKTNAANGGDGLWYPITGFTSTTVITIGRPYIGTAIAAGTAAYTIGDVMVIPERYQMAPVYYAAAQYWFRLNDISRGDRFMAMFDKLMQEMKEDIGKKTTDFSIDEGDRMLAPNPNNYIYGT